MKALAERVRPGRSDRVSQHPQAHGLRRPVGVGREDRVTVVEEEPVGVVVRDRMPQLLRDPGRRRVGGGVGVEDAAGADLHHDQHVEYLEVGGHHRAEIGGDDRSGVVTDEGRPALVAARAPAPARQVLPDRSWRDCEPELEEQLGGDALFAPARVLEREPADQPPHLDRQWRPARPGSPPPQQPEAEPLPARQGRRLDHHECVVPVEQPGSVRHDQPRPGLGTRRPDLALLVERELPAQEGDLGHEGDDEARAGAWGAQCVEERHHRGDDGERCGRDGRVWHGSHPASAWERRQAREFGCAWTKDARPVTPCFGDAREQCLASSHGLGGDVGVALLSRG